MAGGLFSRLFTRNTGGTISGPNDDSEFDNIISNLLPAKFDDYSATTGQMDSTADPYPAASQSQATTLAGEIERLRYQLVQILGETDWYNDADGSLADVFTNSATFAGIKSFSGIVIFSSRTVPSKGSDIASATALALGTDGDYFDVTGTTAITSINTIGVGASVTLHFDAILTLTHHATDLVLPGAANITTAAGDEAIFKEYATSDWRCISYTKAAGTSLAYKSGQTSQTVTTQTGAVNSGSTVMPVDDTIPQNTEGDEYMTLAITPKSATSTLVITVRTQLAAGAGLRIAGALFQDATAGALAAGVNLPTTADESDEFILMHTMTSGTTSSTTFKFRAGPEGAGTVTFNGDNTARLFGGVMASVMTIAEVAP